jgi:uncharacterized protein DUF3142
MKPHTQGQRMDAARPHDTPPRSHRQRRLWGASRLFAPPCQDSPRPPLPGKAMAPVGGRTGRAPLVWRGPILTVVFGLVVLLMALSQSSPSSWWGRPTSASRQSLSAFPPVVLWAWERPELLDFIDPQAVGVAFLTQTLSLSGPDVVIRPRLQPLRVPSATKLMAVTRIEVDRLRPPDLSMRQRELAAAAIADIGHLPAMTALQVDFDAAVSHRLFYRHLLQDLRRRLPASLALSITALASWCMYDDWLGGLPVDEVVPMVFRMGADQHRVRRDLAEDDFRVAHCRKSLGISTDEPLPTVRPMRRLYVFHPQSWRPEALSSILEGVRR